MLRVARLLLSAPRSLFAASRARPAFASATMDAQASPVPQKKVAKPKKSPARRTAQVVKDAAMEAKVEKILAILQSLYPDPPIPLDHVDSFQLLVAVVLSAQSTDKSVNKVTPALFARAPTPQAMMATPVAEIQELIRLVGLAPSKAKYLQGLSQQIVERHGGQVPRSLEELEALPGVGHKTASVVVSQGFGVPAFPVDTHIHRCAQRWGLTDGHSVEQTEADLMHLIPRERWTAAHLQIIFFGREHCPAQRHEASACPICSWGGVELKDGPNKASAKRPSMAARLAAAAGASGGDAAAAAALEPVAEEEDAGAAPPEAKKRRASPGGAAKKEKKGSGGAAAGAAGVDAKKEAGAADDDADDEAPKKKKAAAGGRKKAAAAGRGGGGDDGGGAAAAAAAAAAAPAAAAGRGAGAAKAKREGSRK